LLAVLLARKKSLFTLLAEVFTYGINDRMLFRKHETVPESPLDGVMAVIKVKAMAHIPEGPGEMNAVG
jgi:hypothetical protein